jgi:rod shape-determining protein MreC
MLRKKYLIAAMLISALISPFVFYSSSQKPWSSSGPSVSILQEFLYPVEYLWHGTIRKTVDIWSFYFDLRDTAKENKRLRQELGLLQSRIMDYENHVDEAARRRKILGFVERSKQPVLVAEVVGTQDGRPFKSLRISRGQLDGLEAGLPVIGADGIIGRVLRTGLKYADVQVLEDTNFSLDVLVERTRTRGVLQGVATNRCHLQLHRRADIKIGDSIITSGIVGGFPKGLRVGKVVKIAYETDNISQVVSVEPWVDYRQLEEVIVLRNSDRELRKIVEAAGKEWLDKTVGKTGG